MAVEVFTVRGPVRRRDVPGVCARLRRQLTRTDPPVVIVDAGQLGAGDAVELDVLARLRLTARRPVRFVNVPPRLRELVRWAGLEALLAAAPPGPSPAHRSTGGHPPGGRPAAPSAR